MSEEQTKERFEKLKTEWREATYFHSSCSIIMKHKACREIATMGTIAIPWIIGTIEQGDTSIGWSLLLSEITGISPDTTGGVDRESWPGMAGFNVAGMAQWWVRWAHEKEKGEL
jgi:hypothetical protein